MTMIKITGVFHSDLIEYKRFIQITSHNKRVQIQ